MIHCAPFVWFLQALMQTCISWLRGLRHRVPVVQSDCDGFHPITQFSNVDEHVQRRITVNLMPQISCGKASFEFLNHICLSLRDSVVVSWLCSPWMESWFFVPLLRLFQLQALNTRVEVYWLTVRGSKILFRKGIWVVIMCVEWLWLNLSLPLPPSICFSRRSRSTRNRWSQQMIIHAGRSWGSSERATQCWVLQLHVPGLFSVCRRPCWISASLS